MLTNIPGVRPLWFIKLSSTPRSFNFFPISSFSLTRYSPALSFNSFAVFSSIPSIFEISSGGDFEFLQ